MSANLETSPRHALQAEYERGFIDGMQEQMKRSVDRAVNAMAASAEEKKQDHVDLTIAYMSGFHDGKKKREWVGLTDADIEQEFGFIDEMLRDYAYRIEAICKGKNT